MTDMYDIFIIGGGINGAGIARDASGRGHKVYLAEKGKVGICHILLVFKINTWWIKIFRKL